MVHTQDRAKARKSVTRCMNRMDCAFSPQAAQKTLDSIPCHEEVLSGSFPTTMSSEAAAVSAKPHDPMVSGLRYKEELRVCMWVWHD